MSMETHRRRLRPDELALIARGAAATPVGGGYNLICGKYDDGRSFVVLQKPNGTAYLMANHSDQGWML